MKFLITTTGTVSPVIFDDLAGRSLIHPTVDIDFILEFSIEELRESSNIQSAIDAAEITVKDENGNIILNVDDSLTGVIVSGGTNVNITGTNSNPIVNSNDNVNFLSLSADTIYSGSTNISEIINSQVNNSLTAITTTYCDLYDSSGGVTSTSTSWITPIPLNVQRKISEDFSHNITVNNSEVTINSGFTYFVIGRVSTQADGSNSRTQSECRLEINTGVTWNAVGGTTSEMYLRQTNFGATGMFFAALDLNVGDKVRMNLRRQSGSSPVTTQANGSSLSLLKIKGTKGDKGDKGDNGSGSNIVIQKDDVTIGVVTNTLNFEGAVTVTDEGSNKTTVSVSSIFGSEPGDAESDGTSTTTSTSYQNKVTLTTGVLPSGKYKVSYYAEYRNNNNGGGVEVEIDVGGTVIAHGGMEPDDKNVDYHSIGGFKISTLNGAQTIRIRYRRSSHSGLGTAECRRARIEIYRIS